MSQPTNERIEAYFDKHARGYDREMGFFERFVLGHQRHWAVAQAHGEVLEVAVGTGLNLPLYPGDARVLGIDLSEQMLEKARARADAAGIASRIEVRRGDMQALSCRTPAWTPWSPRTPSAPSRIPLRPPGRRSGSSALAV
jgi:ubiquinone/menaquinone biosynthesis C-methylase UbiE